MQPEKILPKGTVKQRMWNFDNRFLLIQSFYFDKPYFLPVSDHHCKN